MPRRTVEERATGLLRTREMHLALGSSFDRHRRWGFHLVARGLIAVAVAAAWAPPVRAADPLADAPFAMATEGHFNEARNDGRHGEKGRWELLEGRLGPDELTLTIRIAPPPHGLPVEPGPAMLFGGFHLYGDLGSDVGGSLTVASHAAVTLERCLASPCEYETEIALPVDELGRAIRRLETQARLMWVSAELTLVRTYGAGSWLQVLPFMREGDGLMEALAGRLGAIEPTTGRLFPYGLFPADETTPIPADPQLFPKGFDYGAEIEKRRREAGDPSEPMSMAPGRLRATMEPPCEGSPALTVHDEAGDRLFDSLLHGVSTIDQSLDVPVDVRWWLTLHDGGGIDFDQGRQGWGVRVGPVGTTEAPFTIDAAFDCSIPRGVVQSDGALVESTEAPRTSSRSVTAPAPEVSPAGARSSPGPASTPASQGVGGAAFIAAILAVAAAAMIALRRLRV